MTTRSNIPLIAVVIMVIGALALAIGGGYWLVRQLTRPPATPVVIPSNTTQNTSSSGQAAGNSTGPNISINLSEGKPSTALNVSASLPQIGGEPLSPDEIRAILDRLQPLQPGETDQVDFKLPGDPIPPPQPGSTLSQPFPVLSGTNASTPTVSSGPLQVLRYAPQGEVGVAPFINITFNQPMVPLGTLSDLAAQDVPVFVEPALPGIWRWLGTKTLTFSYDSQLIDRLPKATSYRVTIPAGTKSVTGGSLGQAVEWTFTTPPPTITSSYPNQTPQGLNPLMFIAFDQRIDPAAMLEMIEVSAGGQRINVTLASQTDIDADEQVKNLVKYTPESRWLAFKPNTALPSAASITVTVKPGAPSAEGPLTTKEAQSFGFSTYAALRVDSHNCSGADGACRPLEPLYINFNNPINGDVYTDTMLQVSPQIPGVSVNIYGSSLEIRGATRGQTEYTVTINKDLQDTFGQKLGHEERLTFRVGKADPVLVGPDQNFVTLDPATVGKKPVFSVYTINYSKLDVKIYAVQPSDWPAFKSYLQNWQSTNTNLQMPGRLVFDKSIGVESTPDNLTQVDISLGEYLDGKFGHFIVTVAPPKGLFQREEDIYWRTIHAWVQITQIGLDAFSDGDQMTVWASALKDGSPLAGVTITAGETRQQVTSGPDGVARLPIPSGATYLVASQNGDQAILPRNLSPWDSSGWQAQPTLDEMRWYVFDDRQMYRPGEEVHIKGWIRQIGGRQDGDVGLLGAGLSSVSYQLLSSQGNEITSGQASVNELGGFDFTLTLPTEVNLGAAQLILNAQGSFGSLYATTYYHSFQIQEFRRPEFEVTAREESSGPYFAGSSATLAVDAKYYAGGALPGADVTWQVTSAPSTYSPPNWPDFTFGEWKPWWDFGYGVMEKVGFYGGPSQPGETKTFSGKTDDSGSHYLKLDFDLTGKPQPVSIVANATVMDVNRQAWSSTTSLLVHPASLYVGLSSDRYFVERGTPLKVDFIVTDLDGNPVSDRPVTITAARMEWKYKKGTWSEEPVDMQTCSIGSAASPLTCTFQTPQGGSYLITAQVKDEQGRLNQSSFTRWVSGGQQPPARKVEQEKVTLIPNKQTYQPGDSAQILVQSPFSPAEGLLTVSRSGVLYTQRFHIEDGTAMLSIPIEEKYIPNLELQVDLVGAAPRTDDQGEKLPNTEPRPAYASGTLHLAIPPLQRTLKLQAVPEVPALAPGGQTTLNLTLLDAAGQPVPGAELAVVVVDEAILALSNYTQADPISVFYTDRPGYFDSVYSRASLVLANPQALVNQAQAARAADQALANTSMEKAAGAMPMALPAAQPTATASQADGHSAATAPIVVRANFNPLATFAPSVRTDGSGQATINVQLPDNLTRYRIMVVAVDESGKRFGQAETSLTARLPLMVRPSAPRFLNFGDKFELPVVLQNQTNEPLEVSLVARAANLDLAADPAVGGVGLKVTVPANQRIEVRFPASTQMAGTARLQVAAVSGDNADAATIDLPVYTPATTEAFATYGVLDEGAVAQPLLSPSNVFAQYGGLEVNTSSTALQALTDALLYLQSYPFECTEQLSSRILSVAALRDVLTAFKADGLPSPAEMQAAVDRDIQRLQGLQNYDGGFPYWRRGFDSIPFNTIHIAHALYRAQQKGFNVPNQMWEQVMSYLRDIENHYPAEYSKSTRWTLSAYALYVRNLMGEHDPDKAVRLIQEAGLENLSMEAIGWLWPVLQDAPNAAQQLQAVRTFVNNHVVETAGAANFVTSYDDQTYLLLSSDRRTDAILLDALISDNPNSDLIPKLVNGLLAHRTKGRWDNTQENVFVLLALDRYFNTYEAQTPDFVARLWLGNTYAASFQFQGRSTERQEVTIPMSYLTGGQTQTILLSKEGAGRLYYRLGLRYAPASLSVPALDMGFVVQRRYEALDDPADVSQDDSGVWHIRAGARVRVHLTMEADNRRYHVALVDPLPAGLEIINPDLAVSQSQPPSGADPMTRYRWWWWTWYEHQNLRDERAEAFTPLLWDGVYDYTYTARATTPGTFIVPPSKAEEMYSPEVFGRSSSDTVIVEDR